MSQTETLGLAAPGDAILGTDLQASVDALLATASDLDEALAAAPDIPTLQAVTQAQNDLRSKAMAIVIQQIDLLAGEARITAAHINAAAQASREAIKKIADIALRLQTVGKLIGFFAAVSTGHGGEIVKAARALKEGLDAAA